jgi:hypothetical protein
MRHHSFDAIPARGYTGVCKPAGPLLHSMLTLAGVSFSRRQQRQRVRFTNPARLRPSERQQAMREVQERAKLEAASRTNLRGLA